MHWRYSNPVFSAKIKFMNRNKHIISEPTRRITMCVEKPQCWLLPSHFNAGWEITEFMWLLSSNPRLGGGSPVTSEIQEAWESCSKVMQLEHPLRRILHFHGGATVAALSTQIHLIGLVCPVIHLLFPLDFFFPTLFLCWEFLEDNRRGSMKQQKGQQNTWQRKWGSRITLGPSESCVTLGRCLLLPLGLASPLLPKEGFRVSFCSGKKKKHLNQNKILPALRLLLVRISLSPEKPKRW